MIPDLEKVVSNYLRSHTSVTPLGTRFVGKTPTQSSGGTDDSWVRVTQLDARDATGDLEHLIVYLLQFDVYASGTGGQPEASTNARTVRAALADLRGSTHDGVTFARVRFTSMARVPDNDFAPARERVILTAEIRAHA
jgi:hypothetical protein